MKQKLIYLMIGVLVGWITVPALHASGEGNAYKDLLHKIINLMEEVKAIDQQVADNTKAIKEKLGAK